MSGQDGRCSSEQGGDKCSREVASAGVARMASVAVSREMASAEVARMATVAASREVASATGRWQVQQWPVGWPV
jgi:hypothetical protein